MGAPDIHKILVSRYGTKAWYTNGLPHNTNGPAIIFADGSQSWYSNGKLHREDGPALIYHGICSKWYLHGERYYFWRSYQIAAKLSDEDMTMLLLKYNWE